MKSARLLYQQIAQAISGYQSLLIAFSGGLDSTVLLHIITILRDTAAVESLQIRAIHINHGLHPDASEWVAHCDLLCRQWQIPFQCKRVTLGDLAHSNIEARAREARYRCFAQALLEKEILLTAHHQDDQCETFLLALKRGSGPAGLASMGESTVFHHTQLLRPLLNVSRDALTDYAEYYGLKWIEDSANTALRFDRNFLRHTLLPPLKQRWPHFTSTVARSAQLCAQQERLLDELLDSTLQQVIMRDGSLSISPLITMSILKRNALIRRWLAIQGEKMPTQVQLHALWEEVVLARCDAMPCLQLEHHSVRRFQQALYCVPPLMPITICSLSWHYRMMPLTLPAALGELRFTAAPPGQLIRLPTADEKVSVRFGLQDRIKLVQNRPAMSAKRLWQQFFIPPWQRQRIPLLYFNAQCIAAADVFVSLAGKTISDADGCYLQWQRPNESK